MPLKKISWIVIVNTYRVLKFLVILAILSGCAESNDLEQNNPDTFAPVITLNGLSTIDILVGEQFTDPGATAADDVDGDVVVSLSGTVDTATAGNYILNYSASDQSGNTAAVSRNVTVTPQISVKERSMGMGISGISDWSVAMPFIDLMKQSRVWTNWDDKNDLRSFNLDEHDWLLSLETDQTAGTVFLTPKNKESLLFDRVIVLYEGEGTLRYSWSSKLVAGESVPGRDVVTIGIGANLLSVTATNVSNPIRNIRIIPEIYLADYEAGRIFNPDWLELVGQFRALRFMDWMNSNSREDSKGDWSNRPTPDDRTWRNKGGVPLEVMIQLANHIGADPWFNIPHLADENYMNKFAAMVRAKLLPSLSVYVEHSNEVWNWGFPQSHYANQTGRGRWGDVGNAYIQWHGMRTAQICDAFKLGAFADAADRVKCVLGVQTAYHGLAAGAIECPLWVAEGNEPCYKHGIDYIGLTTYFSGGLNGPAGGNPDANHAPTLRNWLNDADGGLDRAFAQLNFGSELTSITGKADYKGVVQELRDQMTYWSTYASQFGLGLVAYEGGQHITANGITMFDEAGIVDFHVAINRDERMGQVYTDIMQAWKDGGGALHMHFVEMGTPGKYGSWGNLENLSQQSSPRWDAITHFNNSVVCWWPACSD